MLRTSRQEGKQGADGRNKRGHDGEAAQAKNNSMVPFSARFLTLFVGHVNRSSRLDFDAAIRMLVMPPTTGLRCEPRGLRLIMKPAQVECDSLPDHAQKQVALDLLQEAWI